MSSENRSIFESQLLEELKLVAAQFEGVVASKNKLKFKHNKKVVGELFLEHLARVDAYVLGGMVYGGEIFDCCSKFTPPYKSNLFSEGCFSFISSGEQNKKISRDSGGAIKTPDQSTVREICAHIRLVLEEYYVPRLLACIVPAKRTINDVLSSPDEYAYPAIFIHCAAKLEMKFVDESLLNAAMSSKKIIKSKDYDIPLLSALI